jgi:hypothetical protein
MRRIYPWYEWFTYKRLRLQKGKHYSCSTSTMSQQVRNAASAYGVAVHVIDELSGLLVLINKPLSRKKKSRA